MIEEQLRRMDQKLDDRFERIMHALGVRKNVHKDVQELKEFRIRMEERQKLSA